MKKLKYLLLMIPFMFISSVKASTELTLHDREDLSSFHEIFTNEEMKSDINYLIKEYTENYMSEYPYYLINLTYLPYSYNRNAYTYIAYNLYYYKSKPSIDVTHGNVSSNIWSGFNVVFRDSIDKENTGIDVSYMSEYPGILTLEQKDTLIRTTRVSNSDFYHILVNANANPKMYSFNAVYYSNFDLTIKSLKDFFPSGEKLYGLNTFDLDLMIPTASDKTKYFVFNILSENANYQMEKTSDYDNLDINFVNDKYVEVDLNSYPYIALSLKDYSKTEAFDVNNYVKGQYCLTPVYDYGLKERREVLSQTQVERCSPYYNDFTLIRTTILKSDLDNYSIYYLKAYDTSKENKVKIDTSIFNIHYITEEDKDNPILNINGTKYSTLPFDKLTDTSNKSEDEGYVSGATGEIKVNWSDIFTSPLDFIKGIWSSVTQVFVVIGYFISLLPVQLQYFLYISFMLAIILGLIKIIL